MRRERSSRISSVRSGCAIVVFPECKKPRKNPRGATSGLRRNCRLFSFFYPGCKRRPKSVQVRGGYGRAARVSNAPRYDRHMTTAADTDIPIAHTDPVNAQILAVSEDRIQGFVRDPFGEIAR